MSKKYISISIIMSIFWLSGSGFAKGPGAEVWKDDQGHSAPADIRKAADILWDAVESEGISAFDAGYGMVKKTCGICRICGCLFTCGITECCFCIPEYDKFGTNPFEGGDLDVKAKRFIFEQKTEDVNQALALFKEAVNNYVVHPEEYSGDADICKLGDWVEDYAIHTPALSAVIICSCRRDLSKVPKTTMEFVNSHGGWNSTN